MAINGALVLPRQASASLQSAPAGYLATVADDGTGKIGSIDEFGEFTPYGVGTVDELQIFYFGKHGSDSNGY